MLTNEQMTPNRFGKWSQARKRINFIKNQLRAGKTVYICTYTRATPYTAKHYDWFRATKTGAYVQRGKGWDCIDYCAIRVQ